MILVNTKIMRKKRVNPSGENDQLVVTMNFAKIAKCSEEKKREVKFRVKTKFSVISTRDFASRFLLRYAQPHSS